MLDRNIAPEVRPFVSLTMPGAVTMSLDNGVTMHVIDQGEHDVFNLTAVWRGGSAECSVTPGLPQMVLNLMREGAGDMNGAEVSDRLEFNGARLLTSADGHYSVLRLYSLCSKADDVLPLMATVISSPHLPEEAFAMMRERQAQQTETLEEKVEYRARNAVMPLMMGENAPLARADTPQVLRALTRDDAVRWHETVFRSPADNLTLYLSGRVTPGLIESVNRSFGQTDGRGQVTGFNIVPFVAAPGARHKVEMPDKLQSAVRIYLPAPTRDNPDYINLRILIVALGGYFGSRLMMRIREDLGLTYGINSYLLGYREGGIIGIDSSTDPSNVDLLIEETMREMRRLATGDFSVGEIDRLRQYLMSGLASSLDSPFEIADYHITRQLSHIPGDYFSDQIKAINSITPATLAEMARRYVTDTEPAVVVAGR